MLLRKIFIILAGLAFQGLAFASQQKFYLPTLEEIYKARESILERSTNLQSRLHYTKELLLSCAFYTSSLPVHSHEWVDAAEAHDTLLADKAELETLVRMTDHCSVNFADIPKILGTRRKIFPAEAEISPDDFLNNANDLEYHTLSDFGDLDYHGLADEPE